jgi:tetratricopeptide (TPR) repeat protein
MTDDLYERYKEALRVGHVAVLRGALEEALAAYQTAASIAPSRALPHTSLGGVMLRLGHLEDALVEYAAAVARAPHDEGALLGQAEALTLAGQRVDAAQALDHVSEIQEAAGRLPEAADTLRRALELDDTPERARRQRGLLREIRLSAGDQAAEKLLARALRLRDEPSGDEAEAARRRSEAKPSRAVEAAKALEPAASPAAEPVMAEASPPAKIVAPVEAKPGPSPMVEPVATAPPEPMLEMPEVAELVAAVSASGPDLAASIEPILAAVGVMDGAFDTEAPLGPVGESQHQPTGDELLAAAEAADQAGDLTALRSLLLWTARAYAREGRFEAGLDATHRLLQRAPGDVDAHLVLVELYVARDWNGLAAEKLALLGRLAELNDDEATRQRVCKVSSRVFPNDERLGALCA